MRSSICRLVALVLAVTAAAACTRRTPEQQLVYDAAEALGGQARIEAAAY